MDILDYLRLLRKRWILVAVCTLLALAGAAGATLLSQPVYQSETQLFVSARNEGDGIGDAYQGGLFGQLRVKSYADIVASPPVTEAVVRELRLDLTAEDLAEQITSEAPLDTVLINVTVSDTSATRARDISAAVATRFASLIPEIETPEGSSRAPVKVTVTKPASLPIAPSSPRPKLNLALGFLVGLAVGVGAAVLRETLDTTIKGSDDVQALVGSTPLGVIANDPTASQRPLVVGADGRSPRAEAFRQLRTNLQFVDVDQPPRSVVVTSAVPEEGKSTTCCNLAISLAEADKRVILVEADLRRPRLAEYLGMEPAVGLTSVLTGESGLDEALQSFGRDLLLVLPSGPLPPNPSEILGSQHMRDLIGQLTKRADIVLFDAPPLLPVTDAAVLARATDGALFVIRHGHTRRDQVERAVEALNAVGARLLGAVLNRVPTKGADANAYTYHYYQAAPKQGDVNGSNGTDKERTRHRGTRAARR